MVRVDIVLSCFNFVSLTHTVCLKYLDKLVVSSDAQNRCNLLSGTKQFY